MKTITLPNPQKDLQFPLMKALELRRTIRKWTDSPISLQDISNILWAACGVNQISKKEKTIKRTAPSACNSQEIRVCVAIEKGVYEYDEWNHTLTQVLETDIRKHIGTQKMMHSAPLALIYISDYAKMTNPVYSNETRKLFTSAADTGFISQNVYLYCAAANLSTAVLGLVDKVKLHNILELKENEKVIYTQVIGKTPEDLGSVEIPEIKSQEEFDQIFNQLYSKSNAVIERAAYVLKKLLPESSMYIKAHIADLLHLMNETQNSFLKRYLPEIVSKIDFTEADLSFIWEVLTKWALDDKEGRTVRANSVEALYVLSSKHTELTKYFENIIAKLSSERIPSIHSRLKKLNLVN